MAEIIAYFSLYQPFFEGEEALPVCYMRMANDPLPWPHVMKWQIPEQVLRFFLFAAMTLPFLTTWKNWRFARRTWTILVGCFVLAYFAATVPSGSNIEGFIYMRPEFVEGGFWKGQPEAIIHSFLMSTIVADWGIRKNK